MKDTIVLEINGKRDKLGYVEIDTPNELLLSNNIDAIVNNRIFEEFIDGAFFFVVEDLAKEYDKKIKNVFITFVDNNDEFICSVMLDKLKPKRCTYRMKIIDWKANGYTFKFVDDEEVKS